MEKFYKAKKAVPIVTFGFENTNSDFSDGMTVRLCLDTGDNVEISKYTESTTDRVSTFCDLFTGPAEKYGFEIDWESAEYIFRYKDEYSLFSPLHTTQISGKDFESFANYIKQAENSETNLLLMIISNIIPIRDAKTAESIQAMLYYIADGYKDKVFLPFT